MPAPQIILDLVQRFADSRVKFHSGYYNDIKPNLVHSLTEPSGHNEEPL